ncbi:hypothetical protein ERJ75_000584000 [Trypanosoma vivax]|nr:hypothetical protein ERJ75_000584000 [Trypanosoma vivax]
MGNESSTESKARRSSVQRARSGRTAEVSRSPARRTERVTRQAPVNAADMRWLQSGRSGRPALLEARREWQSRESRKSRERQGKDGGGAELLRRWHDM